MQCAKCNAMNDDSSIFCEGCGNKLGAEEQNVFCGECGAKIESGNQFCPGCGTAVVNINETVGEEVVVVDENSEIITEEIPVVEEEIGNEDNVITEATVPIMEVAPVDVVADISVVSESVVPPAIVPMVQPVEQVPQQVQQMMQQGVPQQIVQPGMPPMHGIQPQQMMTPGMQPTVPAVENSKISSMMKTILIASIAAVVVIFGGLFIYFSSITKPTIALDDFCSNFTEKGVDSLYDLFEFPESEYISRASFKRIFGSTASDIGSCEYKELRTDGDRKIYQVVYIDAVGNRGEVEIAARKTPKKRFILFDNWVLDASENIIPTVTITVPNGSKVEIDASLIEADKIVNSDDANRLYDIYEIQNLFKTQYSLRSTHPIYELHEETLMFKESHTISGLRIKNLEVVKLQELFVSAIEMIYDIALIDESSEELEKMVKNETALIDFEMLAEKLRKDLIYELTEGDKAHEFEKVRVQVFQFHEITTSESEVTLRADYRVRGNFKPSGSKDKFTSFNQTFVVEIVFQYVNDEWKLVR